MEKRNDVAVSKLIDCITIYISLVGSSYKQKQDISSRSRNTSVLFDYVRFRLAIFFCRPDNFFNIYIWTLEQNLHEEQILIDCSMILTNNNR